MKHLLSNNLHLLLKSHSYGNTKLKNLEIIFQQYKDIRIGYIYNQSNLTLIQISNQTGSQIEREQEWGICHLLEHMFFKGSKKRPDYINFMHSYSLIGASMNAYTDYDHTNFYIYMMNDVFDEGFDIIADMYLNPLLPEKEFYKEINPVLSEIREKEDDPAEYIFDNSMKSFLNNYHPILGTKKTIKNIKIEDLLNFKQKYYGNNNTIITGIGGIPPERFFKKIEQYFSENHNSIEPNYSKIEYKSNELNLTRKDIQEGYVLILYPALEYNNKNIYKESIMNYIFGGMDSSLLYERIREELGLSCYEIYSSITRNLSFSVLEIFAGISPKQISKLIKEIQNIINILINEGITNERLTIAKNTLKTNLLSSLENSTKLSNILLNTLLKKEFVNPIENFLTELENITVEDIKEIAKETFTNPYFIATLEPKKKLN